MENLSKEKQIKYLAQIMCYRCSTPYCEYREKNIVCDAVYAQAESIYNAGYRKQKAGRNMTEQNTVDEFICSECGVMFADVSLIKVDEDNKDVTYHEFSFKYCPNCGAKMKGGAANV